MWTGENDAKTLRVDASFFENEKKSCVFKRIRIRVERAWIKLTPAEIHGRARREELLSRSKLKQAFLIDSDAELFMYLFNVLGPAHENFGVWTGP